MTTVSIVDRIKASEDVDRELVDIPEWGVAIEIRSMSARQRAGMANYAEDDDHSNSERQEALWGFLLTSCCFDPDTGERVFSADDMEWLLNDKSFKVIDRLTAKCLSVSAVLRDSVDEAGKGSLDSLTEME